MKYQVGGCLHNNDPTYIVRQTDEQLYTALKAGKFCYVLNPRQMGKSSLLQRTSHRLQKEGYACVYLNATQLAGETITPVQWYRGMITVLVYSLNLANQINLQQWWEQQPDLSPVQQLYQFVDTTLLRHIKSHSIYLFIDEIDSLLNLRFPVSEFFAWIHDCHQQHDRSTDFNRLRFALFGVASPSELTADKCRTPFASGTAIELHGFQLHEAAPLFKGLAPHVSQPQVVLQEILYWTNGQPFLTQKLCQLVLEAAGKTTTGKLNLLPGTESLWVRQLVQSQIIQHWEFQDAPEHLRTIHDRLLFKAQRRRLRVYQRVLASESGGNPKGRRRAVVSETVFSPSVPVPLASAPPVAFDNSLEQTDLLLSGLVEKHRDFLRIKNPIYRQIFNAEWVRKQ